jgi:hypothetical protein
MHLIVHAATAVPCLVLGFPWAAVGCVLPDIAWVPHELRLRRSGTPDAYLQRLQQQDLLAYRCTHSLLLTGAVACLEPALAAGMLVHILLDLPSHSGTMTQVPLYPLPWRWPECMQTRRTTHGP